MSAPVGRVPPGEEPAAYWDGILAALGPGRVVLGVEGMQLFADLLDAYPRLDPSVRRLPERYDNARRRLRAAVAQAEAVERLIGHDAQAGIGHSDIDPGESGSTLAAWVGTSEIAKRLNISTRQAHRLVTEDQRFGPPRWRGGRWEVPALQLDACIGSNHERSTA